jgi:hypothetical protein
VSFEPRPDKSTELNLFAQLCGLPEISPDIRGLYTALRTCISIGKEGWGLAVALVNVALGGNVAAPDVFTIIPPGYVKYLTRVALVDEVRVRELLRDIPFPRVDRKWIDTEDKKREPVTVWAEKLRAFGFYVEYKHPDYGVTKQLWIIYDAGTRDYPYKYFPAPTAVTELVYEMLRKTPHYEHMTVEEAAMMVKEALREHTVEEVQELIAQGKIDVPEGVYITKGRTIVQSDEAKRRRHRSPPSPPAPP